jgi:surfeit locus 1 family protein
MRARLRFVVVTLAALALGGLTARLGVWQLERASQKLALQRAVDERALLPALPAPQLAHDAAEAAAQHHRRVRLEGRWLAERTVWLENRPMDGRTGFYVVTPLQLPDGRAVLVQRGWQPRDLRDRTLRPPLVTPPGMVTVRGRIAPPPGRLYEFDAAASGPIRQNLDLNAFARETGLDLAPLSVLQTEGAPDDGLRRDWPAPALDVHRNQGYAFQWFALSALTFALYAWFQFFAARRRARAARD